MNDRYSSPPAQDGHGGPHPLAHVPQEVLDAARAFGQELVELGELDVDLADPISDAWVQTLLPWMVFRVE